MNYESLKKRLTRNRKKILASATLRLFVTLAILAVIAGNVNAYCGDMYCDPYYENQFTCAYDCAGIFFDPTPLPPYGGQYNGGGALCEVYAYDGYQGESVPVDVYYYGWDYPGSILVDCGNGRTATAYFMWGSYVAHTSCYYDLGGAYYVDAYSGGLYCPGNTVYIHDDYQDYGYCGDGVCDTYEWNGGTCAYDCGNGGDNDYSYCGDGVCDWGENELNCAEDCEPEVPVEPSCGLTASPGRITEGYWSVMTARYYDMEQAPNVISVDCGNGESATATGCSRTTGSCTASCYYPNARGEAYHPQANIGGTSCSPASVYVDEPYVPIYCSSNADCPDDGYVGLAYCLNGNAVKDYIDYTCVKPGEAGNACEHARAPQVIEECANGCSYGSCNEAPAEASCHIATHPSTIDEGQGSVVTVYYQDLAQAPNYVSLNCGNGEVKNVPGCSGTRGSCTSTCYYSSAGRYEVQASASGVSCAQGNIIVNEQQHLPSSYYGDGTYWLMVGDQAYGNNNYGVELTNVQANPHAQFNVLNPYGQVIGSISLPAFSGQEIPYAGNLRVSVEAVDAHQNSAVVTLQSPGVPTPSATPQPDPECALSAVPSHVQEGSSSSIIINYYNLNHAPYVVPVDCGNGRQANALNCLGTTGSCAASCFYPGEGSFTAVAIADGTACSTTSVEVSNVPVPTCNDGTRYGECSTNQPFYCDDGFLVKDAQVCGCPVGQEPEGNRCVDSMGYCSTSVNPYPVRANEPMQVLIRYNEFPEMPNNVRVVCGNGRVVQGSCAGTETSGTCTAQCTYEEQAGYPQTYTVDSILDGVRCESAQAKVTAPSDTTGTLLVKATDCGTGAALQSATVSISGHGDEFTDGYGQVQVELDPGQYQIIVDKEDYAGTQVSKRIELGKVSTAFVCLEKEDACEIKATLVSSPNIGDSRTPLQYEIRVDNEDETDSATIITRASSSFTLNVQPSSFTIPAGAAQLVSVQAYPPVDFTGNSVGIVTFTSAQCSQSIELPMHVEGSLGIEVNQPVKEALPNRQTCFDFSVRNRGGNEGVVVLSYTGDYDAYFNTPQFRITPHEIRDRLEFCVNVPDGVSGPHSFNLRASSPIADAYGVVQVDVLDSGQIGVDAGGCFYANADVPRPISITNDAQDGDYSVELQYNDIGAQVTPPFLYNFKKGTERTVYLTVNPDQIGVYEKRLLLVLKKEGRVIVQEDLCVLGDYSYGGGNGRDVYDGEATLLQNSLQLERGRSGSTTMTVENTGRIADTFQVEVDGLQGSASPDRIRLRPGESAQTSITVRANVAPGSYTVPVKLYSSRGGIYFEGYYPTYDPYYDGNYGYGNGAEIYCGNGRTVTENCPGSTGSCTVECDYSETGTNTVTGRIRDVTCEETKIKVVHEDTRTCQIGIESFARPDDRVSVAIEYRNLNQAPTDNEIEVDCGNGDRVTATGCSGTTGSCGTSCTYEDEGAYFATADTEVGCGTARIRVDEKGEYCSLDAEPLVVRGRSADIELNYRGVEYGYGDEYYPPYNPYSDNRRLLDTENLLVTVTGAGYSGTPLPNGPIVEISRIVVQELPENGAAIVSATLKNLVGQPVQNIALFVDELPAGVVAEQVAPVSLAGYQERIVRFRLQSTQAIPGGYRPRLRVQYGQTSHSAPFNLEVIPESEVLNATLEEIEGIECQADGVPNNVRVRFKATNEESFDIGISGILKDLPEGWTYRIGPVYQIIHPQDAFTFNATINTTGYEAKDLPMVLEVRHRDGRRTSLPFDLKLSQCGGMPFAGLITLNTDFSLFQLLVVLAVIAMALLIYYSARPSDEEKEEEKPAEEEGRQEHEKGVRQLTLESIKEEVRGRPEDEFGDQTVVSESDDAPLEINDEPEKSADS